MKNDFIIPALGIKNRITTIQKYLQNSVIDALCILQNVDLSYFSGTAQNGLLCTPAGNNPLHFINKYLPRAEKESSLLYENRFSAGIENCYAISETGGRPMVKIHLGIFIS